MIIIVKIATTISLQLLLHQQLKLRLKTLPQILSIQLKRFRHDILGSFQATKIQSHINFPLFLNVTEYSVINDTDYIYQLFAVVCHQGSINTGHYTVFIKIIVIGINSMIVL